MSSPVPAGFEGWLQQIVQNSTRQGSEGAAASAQLRTGLAVISQPQQDGTVQRGVVLDGQFVAVDIPGEIPEGSTVDVNVVLKGPEFSAQFVRASGSDSAALARDRLLEGLLKSLSLNQESLNALRTVLAGLSQSPDDGGESSRLPEALVRFLTSRGVPDILAPDPARNPLVDLRSLNRDTSIAEQLVRVLRQREATGGSSSGMKTEELVRQLATRLELFVPDAVNEQSADSGASPAQRQVSHSLSSTESSLKQMRQVTPALSQILETVLSSTPENRRALELEPFRKLVMAQLEQLKVTELKVNVLLRDIGGTETLGNLVNVLDALRQATEGDTDPAVVLLNRFARDMLKAIQDSLARPEDVEGLRRVLREGLTRLYSEFGLVPYEQRVQTPESAPSERMPPEYRGMLRLVESQLVAVLSDPDLDNGIQMLLQGKNQQLADRFEMVKRTLSETVLTLAGSGNTRFQPLEKSMQSIISRLEQLLKPDAGGSGSQVPVSAEELRRMFGDLRAVMQQTAADSDLLLLNQQPVAASLNDGSKHSLRQVERILINLLAVPDETGLSSPGVGSSLERFISLVESSQLAGMRGASSGAANPALRAIKLLIEQIALNLPAAATPVEQQLSDAVFNLGAEFEKAQQRPEGKELPALKTQVQRSLVQMQQFIGQTENLPQILPELRMVDSESLRQAGAMMAAQETLQRMVPVMRAQGEPVLLLFPFFLGNLMSRAQCTFYPQEEEERQKKAKGSPEAGETFKRLKVVVPLPGIGRVMADAAYRTGELLLNLGYENQKVADFVEERIVWLRQTLAGMGFMKIEIASAVVAGTRLGGEELEAGSLRTVLELSGHSLA